MFACMIFLQAAARRASPSGACLALAEHGLLELYVSTAILAEIQDVISRPQIRTKFRELTDDVVAEFITRIERIADRVDEVGTGSLYRATRRMNRTLTWAAECQADYLVSRDRDLPEGADAIAETMPNVRTP